MARTADYTIQGFMYQFLITLSKLLESSDNAEITVEGVIEDIDVETPCGVKAIQCKYHETKTKFTLSSIYKPVLQMLCHFKENESASIEYRLHAHFPNEAVGTSRKLTKLELEEIMKTGTIGLQSYIKKLTGYTNTAKFLDRFEIHFGASYKDTERLVIVGLSKEGITIEDVEEIFYPNAVHFIAELSVKHDMLERKIQKKSFLSQLKQKKKTAISRWTKELQSYENLLKKRRSQLKDGLNMNHKIRGLILDSEYINDFETSVVSIVEDFVNKYNSKIRLNHCPVFSLVCDETILNSIWERLIEKEIVVERGYQAGKFDGEYFLRHPMKNYKEGKSEFRVRICNHNGDFDKIIKLAKFHDLFIISDKRYDFKNLKDTVVEQIETPLQKEIKYLLSLTTSL